MTLHYTWNTLTDREKEQIARSRAINAARSAIPDLQGYPEDAVLDAALAELAAGGIGGGDGGAAFTIPAGRLTTSPSQLIQNLLADNVRDFVPEVLVKAGLNVGDGLSHPLSDHYATLAEAQAVYPHATSLDDEMGWCALQAMANEQMGGPNSGVIAAPRRAKNLAHINAGAYVINRPVKWLGGSGAVVYGDGKFATAIIPKGGTVGSPIECAVDVSGFSNSVFRDFSVEFSDLTAEYTYGVYTNWDPTTSPSRSTTDLTFRDLAVAGKFIHSAYKVGVQGSGVQADQILFDHCYAAGIYTGADGTVLTGYCQHGFYLGTQVTGNPLIFTLLHPTVYNCQYGVANSRTNVTTIGGNIQTSGKADYWLAAPRAMTIIQPRSEHSARFIACEGVAGQGCTINVIDAYFNVPPVDPSIPPFAPDGKWIDISYPGTVNISGVCYNYRTDVVPVVQVSAGGAYHIGGTIDLTVGGATLAQGYNLGGKVQLLVTHAQMDENHSVIAMWPQRLLSGDAAGTPGTGLGLALTGHDSVDAIQLRDGDPTRVQLPVHTTAKAGFTDEGTTILKEVSVAQSIGTGGAVSVGDYIAVTNGILGGFLSVQDYVQALGGLDIGGSALIDGDLTVGQGINALNGTFTGLLHGRKPVSVSSTSTTLTDGDEVWLANASGGDYTGTLPTAVGRKGRAFWIFKTDASAHPVTIAPASGQTISGAATITLARQWDGAVLISDDANWVALPLGGLASPWYGAGNWSGAVDVARTPTRTRIYGTLTGDATITAGTGMADGEDREWRVLTGTGGHVLTWAAGTGLTLQWMTPGGVEPAWPTAAGATIAVAAVRRGTVVEMYLLGHTGPANDPATVTMTADGPIDNAADLVVCNPTTNITIVMPPVATARPKIIKNISAHTVNVVATGAETFDGDATVALVTQWDSQAILPYGSNFILS